MKPVLQINDISLLIETMLKNNTEENVLNMFSRRYEAVFSDIADVMEKSMAKCNAECGDEMLLASSVLHAAAISSGSMVFAENALSELHKLSAENGTSPNGK